MCVHAGTEVFSPYDRGVDLIPSSVERREAVRERLSGWLSSRADGLLGGRTLSLCGKRLSVSAQWPARTFG
jgi:hypothetical protein